jgi:hypothetical protein
MIATPTAASYTYLFSLGRVCGSATNSLQRPSKADAGLIAIDEFDARRLNCIL